MNRSGGDKEASIDKLAEGSSVGSMIFILDFSTSSVSNFWIARYQVLRRTAHPQLESTDAPDCGS
jgi:hypothetical protein